MALVQAGQIADFFAFKRFVGKQHQHAEAHQTHHHISDCIVKPCGKADGAGHKRQQNKAHVRHRRIGQHALDIALHNRRQVTHQQGSHGQNRQHGRPIVHRGAQTGHQNTEGKHHGGNFRHRAHKSGHGSGRTLIHIGHPHMKRHRAQLESHRHHDKHQAKLQQPSVGLAIVGIGQHAGKLERACGAIHHGNAIQQQTRSQRTQHKIFQSGFSGIGRIAAQRNHRIERQRQQLQTDIGGEEMAGAHHHAHAAQRKQR